MTADLVSLAIILLVAFVSPVIAQAIPGKPVPETVFLLIAGALLGPYMANLIQVSHSIDLLSELGLGFLFLLAGYEINPKSLTGKQGRYSFLTWLISLGLAFAVVRLSPEFSISHFDGIAIAIALTTTALGTLLPILKERGLTNTRVGDLILSYGTFGEVGPVIAMAILLSTRAQWLTILILLLFVGIAVLIARIPKRAEAAGSKVFAYLSKGENSTAQTIMRSTVLLLVGLIALSAVFNLDIVLGAFAAGFVLRYVMPEGNSNHESKLEGIAYGFLIPVFFVVSGAKIELLAVFERPVLLVGFILMLLLIRAVPIFVSLSINKETRDLSVHHKLSVSLYCTTALPIIVAVTTIAVKVGALDQVIASVLISAGAITVFLMPLLASFANKIADIKPVVAAKEIKENPQEARDIISDHWKLGSLISKQEKLSQKPEAKLRASERAKRATELEHIARRQMSLERFEQERARRLRELQKRDAGGSKQDNADANVRSENGHSEDTKS